jgi:hypothetical protein
VLSLFDRATLVEADETQIAGYDAPCELVQKYRDRWCYFECGDDGTIFARPCEVSIGWMIATRSGASFMFSTAAAAGAITGLMAANDDP